MAGAIGVELAGLKEAQGKLSSLKLGLRNKVLRPAVKAACKPVRVALKAAVPRNSGILAKNIADKVVGSRKTGAITGLVGARSDKLVSVTRSDGSTVMERPSAVLHFTWTGRKEITAGVRTRTSRKGETTYELTGKGLLSAGGLVGYGTHVKAVAAKPVLEAAWAASKDEAERTLAQKVQDGIAKLVSAGKI